MLAYAKGSQGSARNVRLGWEEEDLALPKMRVINEVEFPLSHSKYTSDMSMHDLTRVGITIMGKVKPVNETGLVFSTQSTSKHIGLLLEGSRLYLLFKNTKLALEVEFNVFEWNSFSVQIETTKGDCSQRGECCVSVDTFISNEFRSRKEMCVAVTSELASIPSTVTIGKVCNTYNNTDKYVNSCVFRENFIS